MAPLTASRKSKREKQVVELQGPQKCKMPWKTMEEQRRKAKTKEQARARQAERREALKKTAEE